MICGIVVTAYNVVMCCTKVKLLNRPGIKFVKYYDYPTITKETFESSVVADNRIEQFPKITICLNSMHSRRYYYTPHVAPNINFSALIKHYNEHVHNVTTFLYGFYGDNHGEDFSHFWNEITDANENKLDNINLEHFMRVTRPSLEIIVSLFFWFIKKT